MNPLNEPPRGDEVELSLFGPGYGECVVVHLGDNEWAIIDSCLFPGSKTPAPLSYLQELKVNPSSAVKLVIATHWHDDHIRGFAQVASECQSAHLVLSEAIKTQEFMRLAAAYRTGISTTSSGLDEIQQTIQIIQTRRNAKWALADRMLLQEKSASSCQGLKVFSLSPSDDAAYRAKELFRDLFPQSRKPKRAVVAPRENEASVVIWMSLGNTHLLLGADLEEFSDPKRGWQAVLGCSLLQGEKASAFKIPHHGSPTAHHVPVWEELLEPNPLGVISPFSRGAVSLPSKDDIARIKGLTNRLYISSWGHSGKFAHGSRVVEKAVKEATKQFFPLVGRFGQVRIRRRIDEADWSIRLFGAANQL